MKRVLFIIVCLSTVLLHAEDLIDREYTMLKPAHSLSFYSVANKSKIWGMSLSDGVNIIYDKLWNELERHDAGQTEIYTGNHSASRDYEYNSGTYSANEWQEAVWDNYESKYNYSISLFDNYSDFINGKANIFYMIRDVRDSFLNRHTVSLFSDSYKEIAGLPCYVFSHYQSLITRFEIVDWDGNILASIEPPYYIGLGSCQGIEAEDRAYLIVGAYSIYPQNIIKDCDLYSTAEYDLSSKQVEPDYYHYYIYEYNKQTNSVRLIKSETSKANRKLVGVYDLMGNRLEKEQSGINILLYSDGTSEKVVRH